MEQFIRYLYEYRSGQPCRNVGFVKVERGEEQTTVHIHGKGLQMGKENELLLYIFYVERDVPVGILQGTITNINPSVNYRLIFNGEDTGIPENYPKIQGIIMESAMKRRFAAVWNDMPVNVEGMRPWQEPEAVPMTMTEAVQQAVTANMTEQESAEPEANEQKLEEQEAAEQKPTELRLEEQEATEQTLEEQEIDSYIAPSRMQYKKIRRQDIAMLPRCEWRLANNSFLLHGYYNYHHLVLIEDGDELWLGVPGIYHQREARAAEAFGFSRFVDNNDGAVELEADEKETTDNFGYWCRRVRQTNTYKRLF
ncbi:MAG: DUF6128 domain-containing protein [Eubacteriales bacterium]|nr:DUF6128 domain-containing protein [Eubacteriales bacterium]